MTTYQSSPRTHQQLRRHLRHGVNPGALTRLRTLDIAYTPDSDDAFNFYAWEHDRVALEGFQARFRRSHICVLNHAAAAGLHDVVAVSSVMYPSLVDRYFILATGNSIGRGYGPVLVSTRFTSCGQLRGKRVGVADISTTGGVLALMYCEARRWCLVYDRIADDVVAGELDAGVMIHEELLHFPDKGLRRVCDLGRMWCDDTQLPLPVGLNLVRRSLGRDVARDICRTCRDSLRWAHAHYDEAFEFACRFGRGCAEQHIAMFSNDDTDTLPDDARRASKSCSSASATIGLGPAKTTVEIIDA